MIKTTSRKNMVIVGSSTKNSLKIQLCLSCVCVCFLFFCFVFFIIIIIDKYIKEYQKLSNLYKSFTKSDKKENEIKGKIIKDMRHFFKSKGEDNVIKDRY